MEPLSVGVHSVAQLGGFKTSQTIAVFGCGPVGLLCMAVAKALGARRVIAVDIIQSRLDFAATFAGAETFLPSKTNEGEKRIDFSKRTVKELKEKLGIEGRGTNAVDLVIDASGAEVCIQMGLFLVKVGGTYVQVSLTKLKGWILVSIGLSLGWDGSSRSHYPNRYVPRERAYCQGVLPIWRWRLSHGYFSRFFGED